MDHSSFEIWSYRPPGILRDLWKVINNSNPLVENFILLSRDPCIQQKITGEYKQKNIEKHRELLHQSQIILAVEETC